MLVKEARSSTRADLKEISITGRTAFRIWHVRSELRRDTGAIARRRWPLLARPCSSGRAVRMLSAPTLLGLSVQHTARWSLSTNSVQSVQQRRPRKAP